jgi:hypothetical protein
MACVRPLGIWAASVFGLIAEGFWHLRWKRLGNESIFNLGTRMVVRSARDCFAWRAQEIGIGKKASAGGLSPIVRILVGPPLARGKRAPNRW